MALADGGWTLIASNDTGPPYGNQKYTEYEESGDSTTAAGVGTTEANQRAA